MNLLWILIIGFVAGFIARILYPRPYNPSGFVLTTALGVAGAFIATWLGQTLGWYRLDQGAGLIGATFGAVIVLYVWHLAAGRRLYGPRPGDLTSNPIDRPMDRRWF